MRKLDHFRPTTRPTSLAAAKGTILNVPISIIETLFAVKSGANTSKVHENPLL